MRVAVMIACVFIDSLHKKVNADVKNSDLHKRNGDLLQDLLSILL